MTTKSDKDKRKAEYERYVRLSTLLGFNSIRSFTNSFGGTLSYPSQVALGVYEFKPNFLSKLKVAHPQVNIDWIKTGAGAPLIEGVAPSPRPVNQTTESGSDFVVMEIKITNPRTGEIERMKITGILER